MPSCVQPHCWPEHHSNRESVGELWLGLLQFYTEEFDFKEHVISIRRQQLLTTFKKQWTSKYIVIEGESLGRLGYAECAGALYAWVNWGPFSLAGLISIS